MRGLNTLFKGLKEKTSQDRLHQFVRSLEALILPDKGNTNKQFVYRCQTFARAGDDTHNLLLEAYAMRSDTEHLNPWDKSVMETIRQTSMRMCAFKEHGKSSIWLVMHTPGS